MYPLPAKLQNQVCLGSFSDFSSSFQYERGCAVTSTLQILYLELEQQNDMKQNILSEFGFISNSYFLNVDWL